MIRVVFADDQTLVRRGIKQLLELTPDIRVVAEASDGFEAVEQVKAHAPDVALFDVRMPGAGGVEALELCRAAGLTPKVILLTTFDDDDALRRGVAAGARGYLLKDVEVDELAEAVRRVAAGATLVSAIGERAREAVRDLPPEFEAANDAGAELSSRELEILRLMAAGMSNREIAEALGLAEGTVKNYVSGVLAKLGVRDRTRAVLKALERGLL